MKKAFCNERNLKNILFSLIAGCFFLFNSCGIDEWYVLEVPRTEITPSYSNSDDESKVFRFVTADPAEYDESGLDFMGTQVFYKIYDDFSNLEKDKSEITSSTLSPESMQGKIDSLRYRQLFSVDQYHGSVQVEVKLTGKDVNPSYILGSGVSSTVPVRNISSSTKDFVFTQSNYPKTSDGDYSGSDTFTDGPWYVALYANSVGHDASFANYYSDMIYLGSVRLDKN